MNRRYGLGHLIIDIIFTLLTGGLWLIVPLLRYLRSNTKR